MNGFLFSPLSFNTSPHKYVFYCCATVCYVALFLPLIDVTGTSTVALTIIPVAAAGWLMGPRQGLLAAIFFAGLNIILFYLTRAGEALSIAHQWPRIAVICAVGAFAGWAGKMICMADERESQLAREREALETEIRRRIAAEEKLSENLRFLEVVMDAIPNPIFYKNGEGLYLGCNDAFCRFLGLPAEQIIGRTVYDLAPKLLADTYRDRDSQLLSDPGVQTYESTVIRHDGMPRDVLFCKATFSRADGSVAGLVGVIVDITEQKAGDRALHAYQEQLRRLTAELSLSEEKQRRQVATELHDNLSQNLAFARIKLDLLEQSCPDTFSSNHLQDVRELVTKTIEGIRSLTCQLSPPLLYEVGFEPAVRQLGETFRDKYGVAVVVTTQGQSPLQLSPEMKITLFQVIRELLVNVVKHSGASRVDLCIREDSGKATLVVDDNGSGFDQASIDARNCFGLFNIRQKLNCLGGSTTIETSKGKGTRVSVVVPF